jgi:hypothetical protein
MTQLRLPNLDPPRAVHPATGVTQPIIWIRRLCVVRELIRGDEYVVRDVQLRRGLNIVWTPPRDTGGVNQLFQDGMSGHTAGKTTFCRLIRYALGEHGLSNERTRRRIRDKFSAGWLLAEVIVDGYEWVVARPFGIGAHSFCRRGAPLDALFDGDARQDYQVFLDAIGGAALNCLPSRGFPTTDQPIQWEHVLPWLSRDQECRFTDFIEWRHSSSDSDAPALSVDERQFIVRTVLGLISDAERAEQLANAQRVAKRKEAVRRAPLFEHQAFVDHERLSEVFPETPELKLAALFTAATRDALLEQRSSLDGQLEALTASSGVEALRASLERAIEEETNAKRDIEDAELRLKAEQGALAALSDPSEAVSLLLTLPPARGYCNQPMSLSRDRLCPLASTLPSNLAAKRSERVASGETERLEALVQALDASLARARGVLGERIAQRSAAARAEMVARSELEQKRSQLLEERARVVQLERQLGNAEQAEAAARNEREAIETLTVEIDASYVVQEQLRAQNSARLSHLSSAFDYVVRAFLGDEVAASVTAAGRSLALSIEHNGERESAAIATVKLLAFDLAALTESVQGRGFFPRFLLHDGPREADLSLDIYERLFLFGKHLEECFSGEPSFQYIITTTTKPPQALLSAPWHVLTLAGVPSEERLLRCDL